MCSRLRLFRRGIAYAVIVLIQALTNGVSAEVPGGRVFKGEGWSATYPATWKYAPQKLPNGDTLHMFMGVQQRNYIPYCQVTRQPLNARTFPEIAQMKPAQIREFMLMNSDADLFSSIYSYVVAAPEFRLIRVAPGTLGKDRTGMAADFSYAAAQGFRYRAKSFYAFGTGHGVSVWCQSAAGTKSAAEEGYHLSLPAFQQFFADFVLN